jgi:hypothetical protein
LQGGATVKGRAGDGLVLKELAVLFVHFANASHHLSLTFLHALLVLRSNSNRGGDRRDFRLGTVLTSLVRVKRNHTGRWLENSFLPPFHVCLEVIEGFIEVLE